MATTPIEELVSKAFHLSQRAPEDWNAFIAAFEQYTITLTKKLVSADLNILPHHQGQAVQAIYIFDQLANCRQTMQNADAKRNARKPVENAKWLSK
jgi:hypothetical protein